MNAEELFEAHIRKEFVRTDMGNGWMLTLLHPSGPEYLERHKYLDLFDGEDEDYELWKDGMLSWAMASFTESYKDKHFHWFEELVQIGDY